jgi:hypothetical protein
MCYTCNNNIGEIARNLVLLSLCLNIYTTNCTVVKVELQGKEIYVVSHQSVYIKYGFDPSSLPFCEKL